MPFKICRCNQVKDLDRILLAGESPASLSQKYNFSTSDLERHWASASRSRPPTSILDATSGTVSRHQRPASAKLPKN
jgi:hypothetical protein